ncbi:MAG: CDP-alcohol phosphatidyltransferase family protein [Clostridiaceae bacterium]|nr:CDP-alcohol phosphatidyltransferase family protein [Clostridiaceae bacterium]
MNIPNILTALRLFLVPVFGYYLFGQQYYVAAVLFVIGGITDILDGVIARKFNMITAWGKLADPLADKLMQLTALTILTIQELIPLPVLIIVVAKETFMITGSVLLYKKVNFVVQANWYGKLATVIFFTAIVMTMAINSQRLINVYTDTLLTIFVLLAVFSTLFAFFMYTLEFRKITGNKKP